MGEPVYVASFYIQLTNGGTKELREETRQSTILMAYIAATAERYMHLPQTHSVTVIITRGKRG